MFSIIVTVLLQTVVCQVHVVILIGERIVIATSPHVAFFIDVKFVFPREECPYTEVKLPLPVEHGFFHVFLHDPEGVHRPRKNKLLDILDVPENLYTLALIHGRRFHQPDIVFAMFEGKSLLLAASVMDFLESVHKL